MKKSFRAVILFSVLLCVSLFLSGCDLIGEVEETVSESGYYSYYLNKDATQLEKEPYAPSSENDNEILKELMMRIGSKNSDEKKSNLLPQEVTINSYEVQGQTLVIDFNSQYSKMSKVREVLTRAGIVRTFMQLSEIGSVRFTVDGEPLTDTKSQEIGDMRDDTFLEYSILSSDDSYRYDTITLYFTDVNGYRLYPEKRSVYYRRNLPKERVVLEQLIKGPMEKGNYPTLPDNTTVLDVFLADGICYVNLNQYFLNSVLNVSDEVAIYSMVNSLADSCGIEKVEFSIEGNSSLTYGENLSLFEFYEKNANLITEKNKDLITEQNEDPVMD